MAPRLGEKYQVECELISKPLAEYQTDEYFELDLPAAPAVMVAEDIVVEGADVDEYVLETVICKHLELPPPAEVRKGFLRRLFRR